VAGLALLGFFLAAVWRGYHVRTRSVSAEGRLYAAYLTSSLCGMVVSSFLIDTMHWRHFWLLLGMSAALVNAATTQDSDGDVETEEAGGKVRLLLVITQSEFGGAQKYVYYLATRLPQDRYEVTVACGAGGLLIHKLRGAGTAVMCLPHLVRDINPVRDFLVLLDLVRLVRRVRPHIVHANSTKAGFIGRLAAKLAGVPVVLFTAHGFFLYEPFWGRAKRLLYAVLERAGGRLCDLVIAVSEADRQRMIEYEILPAEKLVVVHNGLDADACTMEGSAARTDRSLLPFHGKIVGTVAHFYPIKGLQFVIRAAALVGQGYPETGFVIVGDGEQRLELEHLVKRLGLDSHVAFLGQRDDVSEILPLFDVFVLPSVKEGLPFALLEAMAAARPIVASAVGGIPEVITDGETGLLVPPRDPEALAKAISTMLTDRGKAQQMGLAARERVLASFTVTRMLEQTEQLYWQLLARKCPQRVLESGNGQTR
jgi:glycosyltransferase involved in cell wall biosynthesis